jgi:hypothetical protein
MATTYMDLAGWVVVRLCYYVIVLPLARFGTKIQLERQDSLWVTRGQPGATVSPTHLAGQATYRKSWCRNYVRWATTSGNTWTLVLLPFIAFLMTTGSSSGESEASLNIYTLY